MLHDPGIQVAVEVVGGVDWARQAVLDLLAAGKDVVTANKALLAQHGAEVFDAARRHGRADRLRGQRRRRRAHHRRPGAEPGRQPDHCRCKGILNGTCNFILTGMSEQRRSYAEALAEAQRRGYAEADPTLDVDGTDAAHKLAILAQIAFGVTVPVSAIDRRGIADLQQIDIRYARELGYTIKLLAEAWLEIPAADRRTATGPARLAGAAAATRRRWPRCAAPTTPSTSSATRWATRSTTAGAPARCRRPAPWSPT